MAHQTSRVYHVHPSVAYARSIVENMAKRTGKSIGEWAALVSAAGLDGDKEKRVWLKNHYGLGGTTAFMIVDHAAGRGAEDIDPDRYLAEAPILVENMYAGAKAHLRPLYELLLDLACGLGSDIRICPCKTIVPLYRTHVFAEIKPATKQRIDLGLALKQHAGPFPKPLIDTGGLAKGDRITHRIPIARAADIDDTVSTWLKCAYGLNP